MKVAILGSSGHFRLATERPRDSGHAPAPAGPVLDPAGSADGTAGGPAARIAGSREDPGGLEFLLAPMDPGEDMGPVAASLTGPRGRLSTVSGHESPAAGSGPGGSPRRFDDWRRLLDATRPDIAVINPPFHRIGDAVRECLERGIHVFAEKPLATSWEDYEALRSRVRPDGPRLMAMLTPRYEGLFRAARRVLEEEGLGRPVLLSAQKSYPLQGWDGGSRPDFYRMRKTYGGTLPWLGAPLLDLFRWFSGSDFASVGAAQTTLGNRGHGELESAAALHLTLASGAVASAHMDFLRRREGGADVQYLPDRAVKPGRPGRQGRVQVPWGDDRLRVACEGGVLEVSAGTLRVEGPGGRREILPDPDLSMFDAFLRWTSGAGPMDLTPEDCLKAAEAALRARDAADTGQVQAF